MMATEKGRSARIKAEREAKREEARNCAPMANGTYDAVTAAKWDAEYITRKYARIGERVSGKSHESHLPETRQMPQAVIDDRLGCTLQTGFALVGELGWIPTFPQVTRFKRADMNLPVPDEPKRTTKKARAEYDPTKDKSSRDGSKRPYIGDTHRKLRHVVPSENVSE